MGFESFDDVFENTNEDTSQILRDWFQDNNRYEISIVNQI